MFHCSSFARFHDREFTEVNLSRAGLVYGGETHVVAFRDAIQYVALKESNTQKIIQLDISIKRVLV